MVVVLLKLELSFVSVVGFDWFANFAKASNFASIRCVQSKSRFSQLSMIEPRARLYPMDTTAEFAAARGKLLAIAPMMDWTDRHCRVFHRVLSRHALLYADMVTVLAVSPTPPAAAFPHLVKLAL